MWPSSSLLERPGVLSASVLAGQVEDGVGPSGALAQELECLLRGQSDEFDVPPFRLAADVVHDRQRSAAGPHHQALALPRDLLVERQRRVAVERSVLFGGALVSLPDFTAVDDQVVVVLVAVDTELPEGEAGELHGFLLPFKLT